MKNGIGKLVCFAFAAGWARAQPVSPEWLKSGVIYEINPRTFSATGNFKGIQQKLPYLRQLGVTVLRIMPIHPVGKEKSKGSLGSAYSVQDDVLQIGVIEDGCFRGAPSRALSCGLSAFSGAMLFGCGQLRRHLTTCVQWMLTSVSKERILKLAKRLHGD